MARPAKNPDAPPTKRIQVELAPKPLARLQRLQTRIDAASQGETIRRALWVHETLLDMVGADGRILIERDGVTTEVTLIGMDA